MDYRKRFVPAVTVEKRSKDNRLVAVEAWYKKQKVLPLETGLSVILS